MPTLDDYLNSIRLNQLLGDGSFNASPDMSAGPQMFPGVDMSDFNPQPSTPAFVPQHTATDYMSNLMNQMPVKHDPTMLAKIFAGIAGLGGPKMAPTQDQILTGGYEGDLNDWLKQFGAATTAANLERQTNVAGENASNQQRTRDIQQQRANEYGRRTTIAANKQASDAAAKAAATELAKRKQDLAEFKVHNPNYIYKTDENGMVMALNPQNPTAPPIKTGINSGDLGDLEKHALKLDEIEATGVQQRQNIEATGEQQRQTAGLKEMIKPVASHDTTANTTVTTTDAQGNQTVKTTNSVRKTPQVKTVPMYGPKGEGPYMIPENRVEEAKKAPYNMKLTK